MKKPSLKTEYELILHDGGDYVYEKKIPCYPNDARGRIVNLTQKEMAFITMAMDSIDLSQSSNEIEELRNKIEQAIIDKCDDALKGGEG